MGTDNIQQKFNLTSYHKHFHITIYTHIYFNPHPKTSFLLDLEREEGVGRERERLM